jgi:hypothetical protein
VERRSNARRWRQSWYGVADYDATPHATGVNWRSRVAASAAVATATMPTAVLRPRRRRGDHQAREHRNGCDVVHVHDTLLRLSNHLYF